MRAGFGGDASGICAGFESDTIRMCARFGETRDIPFLRHGCKKHVRGMESRSGGFGCRASSTVHVKPAR
eukprot:4486320-Pleurochrysis_carterae.AAC.1